MDDTDDPDNQADDEAWHDRITVKIVDLGNACRIDGNFKHVIQTRQYRSPEVIIGMIWNDRADIWSLGCLVFELLTGDYLFDPRADTKYGKDDGKNNTEKGEKKKSSLLTTFLCRSFGQDHRANACASKKSYHWR
jgi:serine/threonine protein kinase